MAEIRGNRFAFGKPGIEPRWTHGNKDGVGTAYSGDSRVWFTIFHGVVTEVFFPTVDRPQIRDLQYLITDGETFFHEEKRHLSHRVDRSSDHALCFRIEVGRGGSTRPRCFRVVRLFSVSSVTSCFCSCRVFNL